MTSLIALTPIRYVPRLVLFEDLIRGIQTSGGRMDAVDMPRQVVASREDYLVIYAAKYK
jgi:hypothetical protein